MSHMPTTNVLFPIIIIRFICQGIVRKKKRNILNRKWISCGYFFVIFKFKSIFTYDNFSILGQSLFYLNRFNEAEKWFKSSLVSNSEHVPAHLAYARLLAKLGNKKKAEELYDRALHLQPENTEVYKHYSEYFQV